jgi:hypothetical protein
MKGTYEQNKKSIYTWKFKNEKNLDRCKELSRINSRKYYAWKRISQEFLAILRD